MQKWFAFIFLLSLLITTTYAYEKSDAFIVKIFDKKVKVITPVAYKPDLNIIIENKTLTKILGRVETDQRGVLEFVSIKPDKFKSVDLKFQKGERVYFTPLSPSFQRVELILGKESYEIPPKE